MTALTVIGFTIIFVATTAGAALVFAFRGEMSGKLNTLFLGFAFGAAAAAGEYGAFVSALGLAIGMAIQNFPEGAAVSLPMKAATGCRTKAFLYGMGSGAVEPLFAVVGYFLAANLTAAQPWFLAFAAGAMIFVVVEDLIPDAHLSEHPHFGTWGAMAGFAVMMALDVALG